MLLNIGLIILISLMKWKNLLKDIRVKDINFICCLIAQCNFINIINQNLFFNILKSFIHLQNIKKSMLEKMFV